MKKLMGVGSIVACVAGVACGGAPDGSVDGTRVADDVKVADMMPPTGVTTAPPGTGTSAPPPTGGLGAPTQGQSSAAPTTVTMNSCGGQLTIASAGSTGISLATTLADATGDQPAWWGDFLAASDGRGATFAADFAAGYISIYDSTMMNTATMSNMMNGGSPGEMDWLVLSAATPNANAVLAAFATFVNRDPYSFIPDVNANISQEGQTVSNMNGPCALCMGQVDPGGKIGTGSGLVSNSASTTVSL